MKAGILSVQFNPILADKSGNLDKVNEIIHQYDDRNLDLIVLPEFFFFFFCDREFINSPEDETGGEVIANLKETAKRYNTNIAAGTVIELVDGKRYNTCFVINRQGEIVGKYRKKHLFNFAGGNEDKYLTPGDKTLVVDLDFAKVGVSVCFDIKFPMLYRELIKQGAEIIVSPSAWSIPKKAPAKEKEIFKNTWQAMNICRATESLVYFVTSNLAGNTNPFVESIGNSMITGPMGEVISNLEDKDTAGYADLDMKIVRDFKGKVPVALID